MSEEDKTRIVTEALALKQQQEAAQPVESLPTLTVDDIPKV